MLSIRREALAQGVKKTIANAEQLIHLANKIRSETSYPNRTGYSAMLMQTGLEEVAKASFLFEKYIQSIVGGRAQLSNEERHLWFAGSRSHLKKLSRVLQLDGIITQFTEAPGIELTVYPTGQTAEELFRNRNVGLYVEYSHEAQTFISPQEAVSSHYLTAIPSFARTILYYCRYDYLIERIENTVTRRDQRKLSRAIHDVLKEKRKWAVKEVEKHNKDHPEHSANIEMEAVFAISPDWLLPLPTIDDLPFDESDKSNLYIYYTVSTDNLDKEIWLMDHAVGVTVITKNGAVAHSLLDVPEDLGQFMDERKRALLHALKDMSEGAQR